MPAPVAYTTGNPASSTRRAVSASYAPGTTISASAANSCRSSAAFDIQDTSGSGSGIGHHACTLPRLHLSPCTLHVAPRTSTLHRARCTLHLPFQRPQICLLELRRAAQFGGRSGQDELAARQHVGTLRNLEGDGDVLLDEDAA